ncbi:MAG: hypothetical protein GY863_13865 [bacterium]|nr:hypothetical protein [bacterium]
MNTLTAFDLETVARDLPDKVLELRRRRIKTGNTKDPEKLRKLIEQKSDSLRQKDGTDPDYNRIIAAGFHNDNRTVILTACRDRIAVKPNIELRYGLTERQIVESCARILYNHQPVTFNGYEFDIPVLKRAALRNNVRLPFISSKRYECLDIAQKMNDWKFPAKGKSLEEYCLIYNIPYNTSITGADIESAYLLGKWEEIVKGELLPDLYATWRLYNRWTAIEDSQLFINRSEEASCFI